VRAILFDFFGTLVDYSPSRTEQGYHRTHALLRPLGVNMGYADFLATWSDVSARFDTASDEDDHEFSMLEVGLAFLDEVGSPTTETTAHRLVTSYVADWNQGVQPIDGVPELIEDLARLHRLAVVTNTHDPRLVPDHLVAMGIDAHFEAVITSVEVGWRKPHPQIYRVALDALGVAPEDALFVGDTKGPDYDGPRAVGMRALLIDPTDQHQLIPEGRLTSVLALPERLAAPQA
jgi:putative hydrolase of the HAD superfamily